MGVTGAICIRLSNRTDVGTLRGQFKWAWLFVKRSDVGPAPGLRKTQTHTHTQVDELDLIPIDSRLAVLCLETNHDKLQSRPQRNKAKQTGQTAAGATSGESAASAR